uniref:Hydroxypyruvate isomerase n=1 Tax=Poecilia reticulata TaxID=8081 RepID=A0A3P9Q4F2_POERE
MLPSRRRLFPGRSCIFQQHNARPHSAAITASWLRRRRIRVLKCPACKLYNHSCVAGDIKAGDLGLGAVPGRELEFRKGLDLTLKYAKALNCKRIHLMAGRIPVDAHRAAIAREMEDVFVQNLNYAAGILAKEGITGLIEPINTRITDPRYFLDSPHQAAAILEKVGKPNIQLQMDIFHWQIMDGNLTKNMHKYFSIIGHVQIAQVPGRNEPDSNGELCYRYLLNTLEKLGYQGYIGCEYKPLDSTEESLGWIQQYWAQYS